MADSAEDETVTSPVPQPNPLSKSRTIIRMLTTKLSTPRQPNSNTSRIARPPPVVNAFSKEHREAALRERGLLPPLPMSQQEAMQDQAIPIVSPGHTRDSSQPSAADLIKKEWETKNKKPLDDERERMNGFKFGSTTSTTAIDDGGSSIPQDDQRSSTDIRPYTHPLPPSPSPHPPSSYSRSASPVANPKRRNTTTGSSSSSPAASRSPSPPVSIPSRPLPQTFNAPVVSSSLPAAAAASSPAKPTSVSPAPTPSHTPFPDPHISPANPSPNRDNTPAISFTPPSLPLPPTPPSPPARRSTVGTPNASRAPSRAASRAASPLPQPPANDPTAPGTPPSRSRAGSSSASAGPRRGNTTTLEHKRNEESFSSLMEKSIEAVFAGINGPRSRSGSKSAADASRNPSRSTSPTPVPTPRPNQSPTTTGDHTQPSGTSSFLQAHKRTPTNTTSLSDTLSTSPPPSLFSHNHKVSPNTGELSASGSSSASDALTSDTSAESSPTLPSKPAAGILDTVLSSDDPLDTPPPVPVKNLKLGSSLMPKGKLGGLTVKTKEGKAALPGAPDVVLSPGPVGGAFVMLTPGGGSEVDLASPRRLSDEGSEGARDVLSDDGILSGFDDYDDDDDDDEEDDGYGADDVKSQSAHTDGHLGVRSAAKGRKAPPRRGVTDPGSPAVGSKFASSVSASGHGGNVRNVTTGAGAGAGAGVGNSNAKGGAGVTSPPVAKGGWMSQVKRSVVGTLVRRGGGEKKDTEAGVEKRGRSMKGFNASHLPPSPTPASVPTPTPAPVSVSETIPPSPTPVPHRSKTLSPTSPPPAPSSFWSRAPQRTNTRAQTLSPPTSPRGFSYYSSGNSSANGNGSNTNATGNATTPASPRKAVSPVLYNAGDISKHASAIEDEETRRMTELAFMG